MTAIAAALSARSMVVALENLFSKVVAVKHGNFECEGVFNHINDSANFDADCTTITV